MSRSRERRRSRSKAAQIGYRVERIVCDRRGWEHVADDGDAADWVDAITPGGDRIDIKAAAQAKSHGANRTIPGEWWIQRANHQALTDANGFYALVVYEPSVEVHRDDLVHSLVVPGRTLDPFVSAWIDLRVGDQITKIPWPRIFGGEKRIDGRGRSL